MISIEEDTLYLLIPSIIMIITLMFFCVSPFILKEKDKLLDIYSSDDEEYEENNGENEENNGEEKNKKDI